MKINHEVEKQLPMYKVFKPSKKDKHKTSEVSKTTSSYIIGDATGSSKNSADGEADGAKIFIK